MNLFNKYSNIQIPDCKEYGILSAFVTNKSYEDNSIFHWIMFDDLINIGYNPIQWHGVWDFNFELCWIVPGINFEKLCNIANKYRQEAVVYANTHTLNFSECTYRIKDKND
ncbi:MAG TPA: hypothetical protein ENI76_03650 [Ignavibacteria bacterium]|nr:hypothetical protein [Ignavibacteria bacterium]